MDKLNRRDFLKSTAVLGALSSSVTVGATAITNPDEQGERYIMHSGNAATLQVLENDYNRTQVFSNGALTVLRKIAITFVYWYHSGPWGMQRLSISAGQNLIWTRNTWVFSRYAGL